MNRRAQPGCILTLFLTSVQARRLRYFGGGFAANVAQASRLFGLAGMLAGIRNLRTMSRYTPQPSIILFRLTWSRRLIQLHRL